MYCKRGSFVPIVAELTLPESELDDLVPNPFVGLDGDAGCICWDTSMLHSVPQEQKKEERLSYIGNLVGIRLIENIPRCDKSH